MMKGTIKSSSALRSGFLASFLLFQSTHPHSRTSLGAVGIGSSIVVYTPPTIIMNLWRVADSGRAHSERPHDKYPTFELALQRDKLPSSFPLECCWSLGVGVFCFPQKSTVRVEQCTFDPSTGFCRPRQRINLISQSTFRRLATWSVDRKLWNTLVNNFAQPTPMVSLTTPGCVLCGGCKYRSLIQWI